MLRRSLLAAFCAATAPIAARAQSGFPTRPIRLVVPFAAGGPTDVFARIVAQRMTDVIGQSVVVDNRAGAGGNIGADFVAKSAPDGYTLLVGTVSTHAFNLALYPTLPFDPIRDFVPIVRLVDVPQILVVPASLPARDLRELLALLRGAPGRYPYGSAGNGSSNHVSGAMFAQAAGVQIEHVAYRGSGPALQDVIGGRIHVFFDALSTTIPHIRAGTLRAIGVASEQRAPQLPDVPTLGEAGLPGYLSYTWNILFAPAGTPDAIVARINEAANRVMADDAMRARATEMGLIPVRTTTPAGTADFVRAEVARWAPIVRATGARIE
jgi:tripartite-type tricarboxylate transporter receptor subunit TctC